MWPRGRTPTNINCKMNKLLISKKLNKYDLEVAGAIVIIVGIFLYGILRFKRVEKSGVFSIARVDKCEPEVDGSETYITVFFGGKEYPTTVGNSKSRMVGKFYFVKILPEDPTYEVILYLDNEVPACLLKDSIPRGGWEVLPTCK